MMSSLILAVGLSGGAEGCFFPHFFSFDLTPQVKTIKNNESIAWSDADAHCGGG
jgi:hypothetical protein